MRISFWSWLYKLLYRYMVCYFILCIQFWHHKTYYLQVNYQLLDNLLWLYISIIFSFACQQSSILNYYKQLSLILFAEQEQPILIVFPIKIISVNLSNEELVSLYYYRNTTSNTIQKLSRSLHTFVFYCTHFLWEYFCCIFSLF